jgi:hypothetical protein
MTLIGFVVVQNYITKSLLILFIFSLFFHGMLYLLNSRFTELHLFTALIYFIFTIIALYNPFDFPYLWAYLLYFPLIIGLIEEERTYKVWSVFYIILYTIFLVKNHFDGGKMTRESSLFIIVFILFAAGSILLGYLLVKYLSFVRGLYNQNNEKQIKQHIFAVLSTFIPVVEAKTHTTKNEIVEMSGLMKGMIKKLPDLDVKDWEIELLSLLHFVSRIECPDYIFEKHEALTEYEYKAAQNHCLFGSKLLGDFQSFEHVKEAFARHHQRKDGSGYPNNRPGNQVPKLDQILGLVESYIAMIYPRAYHDSRTREEALYAIKEFEKYRVDPEILDALEEAVYCHAV